MSKQLKGRIVSSTGVKSGTIEFSDRILSIEEKQALNQEPYIFAGFIDVHVHGGGGGDTMDGIDGIKTMAKFHLQHGTTSIYPTTITNPWQNIIKALNAIKEIKEEKLADLPAIMGAHLEGPFISPNRLGAQPAFTLEPNYLLTQEILELDVVRLLTLAPEIENAAETAEDFAKAGLRVSIGHSVANYEEVQFVLDIVQEQSGVSSFTHLYNAMGALQGREPAIVGAAFANIGSYAEIIFDTHHVHPASFLSAYYAKQGKLFFITDAIRATGLPEGKTELGGQEVIVKDGKAKLLDGTLAGSVLTLDQALRNGLEHNLPIHKLGNMLSTIPAEYMALKDRGQLKEGLRADIVIMDKDFNILEVYVAGRKLVG